MPLTITHAKSETIADFAGVITGFNNSGGSTTIQATNLVRPSDWNSAHEVTLSLTGSEVASLFNFGSGLTSTTNTAGVTVGMTDLNYFEPMPVANSSLFTPGIGTWYFAPFIVPLNINSGQINFLAADVAGFLHAANLSLASTGSVSRYQTLNHKLALYKEGTGTNTSRLESFWSADCSFLATWRLALSTANSSSGTINEGLTLSFPAQFDRSGGVTYSSTQSSTITAVGTSTVSSTKVHSLITPAVAYLSGSRVMISPFATFLPAGNYWLAHMLTSSSSSTGTSGGVGVAGTMFQTQSLVYIADFDAQAFKQLGQSVTNTSSMFQRFQGSLATTTSSPMAFVAESDLRGFADNQRLYWNYAREVL